jgi:HD-GYP domain-containing protein (c-di-GMP phosphodiesterase class II)
MKLQTATEERLMYELVQAAKAEQCRQEDIDDVVMFLMPLRDKGPVYHTHYMHSLRVALLARAIGTACGDLDGRALLLAGALHDVGKVMVPVEVLGKRDDWTNADSRLMRRHVVDGYRMIRGRFDFSGAIMLWHHRFQANGYPQRMPRPLHNFSDQTKHLIYKHGRILAMADVYDALHRPNARHGELSGREIKMKMLQYHEQDKDFVLMLYQLGVLTID